MWLESDLAAASIDPNIDWIVMFGHYSLYNWGKDSGHASDDPARNVIETLIQDDVDLFIAGHQHSYERTYPVGNDGNTIDLPGQGVCVDLSSTNTECTDANYPIYFTVGTGGRSVYPATDSAYSSCGDAVNCDQWSANRMQSATYQDQDLLYGHLRVRVDGLGLIAEFIDIDRNVLDTLTLTKGG